MSKTTLSLNDIATILGVDVSIVQKHVSSLFLEKEGEQVYLTVGRFRDIIRSLRVDGYDLIADMLETRLEEFLMSQ